MARVITDILGISKLKWNGMGDFNSVHHYIYYCGQESLRRNAGTFIVNKRVWNAVLGCNLKNDRMSWFVSNTVIEVYAPAINAEKAEVDQFYEDQSRTSRTNTKKRCPFHHRGLECKSRKSRDTWSNRQVWLWSTKWSRVNANRVLSRELTGHSKRPFPTTQETTQQTDITNGQYQNQIDYILCSQRWKSSIKSEKQDQELTVTQIMSSLLPNSDLNWRK